MVKYPKSGIGAFLSVAAFLGGISFTCLLLLIQQDSLFQTPRITYNDIVVTDLHIIAVPLAFSVILFITSTILFSIALTFFDEELFSKMSSKILTLFVFGFVFLIASVFIIVYLINVILLYLCLSLFFVVTTWWSYTYLRATHRI